MCEAESTNGVCGVGLKDVTKGFLFISLIEHNDRTVDQLRLRV